MTMEITPLTSLEVSARMICEAPLCHGRATQIVRYKSTMDGEAECTDVELVCDRCAAHVKAECARAERMKAKAKSG
jgi:hypothetical protein